MHAADTAHRLPSVATDNEMNGGNQFDAEQDEEMEDASEVILHDYEVRGMLIGVKGYGANYAVIIESRRSDCAVATHGLFVPGH